MTVAHILATKGHDVVTAEQGDTLTKVASVMAERRIGAVVVTGGEGTVLGILSERDIVRAVAEGGADALAASVAAHMTRKVVTTTGEETIPALMERMTEGRFRHLPVLKNGRLDGIVSIGDVVKHRLAEIESEASAMRDYIASA
ncbi:inosine-5-monophosphate dehydrogenase [Agaricicola taiwanensis]|uniref:Inosine-5-monophosphate dehydrogenase n=1 Tax=Agaricicola taiwanensis TaxID=591372 RepID=A0A8J2YJV3_9RHOB|nr:CBS domain-containing protein [Agaricicola taiwanensis]GGE47876.1 inosine-5-monophosphate dehydrogenase [Agaricicola taiwanensis]